MVVQLLLAVQLNLDNRRKLVPPFSWSNIVSGGLAIFGKHCLADRHAVGFRTWLVDSPGLLIVDQQVARRASFDCRQLKQLQSLAFSFLGRMSFL